MKRYGTQYIRVTINQALDEQLNEHQARHPQADLVTVIRLHRNPGEDEQYRAVWDYKREPKEGE